MKKNNLITVIVGLALHLQAFSQQGNHVVLISIDGFRPDFYLDQSWPAPNLQKLKSEGAYAREVRSVFPSVTYPSHTTLVTGAYPARHGIYYNAPIGAKKRQWYWEESYIKVPTLWDAVREAGLQSGAVMWPVTVGAPIDYNFPVRRAHEGETGTQLEMTRPFVSPAGLLDEMGPFTMADLDANNTFDITIGKMGAHIIKKYQPHLMALHFITVDHLQHDYGRDHPKVKRAVALVDSMVGMVFNAIKEAGIQENTTVIITGDHGFYDSHQSFSPNVLLAQHGLLEKASFHSAGGSTFLYVKNNDKGIVDQVRSLLTALPEKVFRIIDRDELDQCGANPEVALALDMLPGYVANNDAQGELVKPQKPGGSHGYFPNTHNIATGFIAVGRRINKYEIKDMGVKDIAPLIAHLLQLRFKAPDGVLIPGILKGQ
jgi:Uncharacterized proteins of the AP superfamily